ncbi:TRAP transporter permease [Desulforhopalus sp. IMCC35007]|uniref:TRAP transporter permease n=1 Tax=Desulforhopalus sp. IMCC35007 TaxID=2569543 RepID=UPI0010AE26F2|nr:TRAP transporter permease [Desulforhopalus sp. IMCC35007]TKB06691.1 TRAP transporter permease [Desulforhopalus sp. IMCC35007]
MTISKNVPLDDQAQKVLEKYDKESSTRVFGNKGLTLMVTTLAVSLSLYHLFTSYFGTPLTLVHRSIHLSAILALAYMLYPASNKLKRDRLHWWDLILAILAFSSAIYMAIENTAIYNRGGMPNQLDLLFGGILIVLVIEAARRVTGWALPLLGVLFLCYGHFGRELSGIFRHRGYSWEDIINFMYVTTEGIYGTAIGVSATYIFLFILFGSFLAKSGMGQLFNDMAMAIAGESKGGPAKVAVIASGFLGSINGAAVANVVTTGSFTIPLMKKIGYSKEFAGAVEASASVGGQILPPVMGAAAFIMAEMLGIPYKDIALAATLPALLFYLGVIVQIHLRATKDGLKGISRENLPEVMSVIKDRGHLFIPLIFLMYMLFFSGTTIIYSAFLTIILTVIVAMLRKSTRLSLLDIIGALEDGARSAVAVAIACAAVGIVVGVATQTGFGLKLANGIVLLGGQSIFLTLVFTMLACMVLGMGLPSIPTYIITATIAGPALIKIGVLPLVAHLFVFYFGIFANITPPVALASFAAAGISGGDQMKTGFMSMKLSIAGFIIPYIFVYNNALLMIDTTLLGGTIVALTAVIGVIMLGAAAEGFFFTRMHMLLRIVLAGGAMCFMTPNMLQDIIGCSIAALVLVLQWRLSKSRQTFIHEQASGAR